MRNADNIPLFSRRHNFFKNSFFPLMIIARHQSSEKLFLTLKIQKVMVFLKITF